jgi:subfamily B ATP-binding cassette protein MsbA
MHLHLIITKNLTNGIVLTDKSDTYSSYELSKRLYKSFISGHFKLIMIAFFCMILAAAATAGNAIIIEPILDEIFVKKDKDMLLYIPLFAIGIAAIKAASTYVYTFNMIYVGQRLVSDLQLALFEHLLKSDITLFGEQSSGNLLSRFTNEINVIRKDVIQVLTGLVNQLFTLVFLIGVMLYSSVELALIGTFVFVFAIYPIIRLGKRMRKVSRNTQEKLSDFTGQLEDTFQGIRVVKAYNSEIFEVNRASTKIESIFNLYVKAARISSIPSPLMEMLSGVAIAAIIWYGGAQVLAGETTPGSFFSFIAAVLMAYKPMKALSSLNTNVQEGLSAVNRLFQVLDEEPTIKDKHAAKALEAKQKNIEFKEVNFSYKDGKTALKQLTLSVPDGKSVALVGHSGGGKSTIMNMILRFYDTQSGSISVGGQNIQDVTLQSLRDNIAIVSQEATLFDSSIKDNIRYGKHDATDEEVIEAAKLANAHEFIVEQTDGYETQIGQHGLKLSGGQRQRIAIARAMLKNAPILLLDEATSALDTVSEKKVQAAIGALMENRTTLVIAHRLSTIVHCDIIYVVDGGTIAESGTHAELIKQDGLYAELHAQQFTA